jgi:cell division ATPase FtsA
MLCLVIDIQSDVVEGTLIKFPPKTDPQNPEVLYATTFNVPRKTHANGDYMVKVMLAAVKDVVSCIVKEVAALTEEPIQSVHYILSSPWIISQSKTIEVAYEKDTEITDSVVKKVIETDRQDLVQKYEADMVFVEQKIFDVELNGYSIEKFQGKRARRLKISFAFTLSSDKIVKQIQSVVQQHLHIKKDYFHSAILLQYLSSRAVAVEGEEYIVLHAHGEYTDVVVVKKGFSSYLASFPFGTSTLIRKTCITLNSTFETTDSKLAMYMDKKLDDEEQQNVEKVLMPILKGWQSECAKTFEGIGEHVALPRIVHLYSGGPFAPLFKVSLEEVNFEVVIHDEPLREVHSFALKDVI